MTRSLIDTEEGIRDLITTIETFDLEYPFLFIDLEGVNLSRNGSVSIMQILVAPDPKVYLIDVHQLQAAAFETPSRNRLTLKDILESEQYPKVFFDVRADSDALYGHYQINLKCVIDLQLLEFATRRSRGPYLSGLSKCIELDLGLDYGEQTLMKSIKEAGKNRFAPEKGGRYEVFNERPLSQDLIDYCVQDVKFMPRLLLEYGGRLSQWQATQVQNETNARIKTSQGAVPLVRGRRMAIGPSFSPMPRSQIIIPRHPMNIICSASILQYCQLRDPTPTVVDQPETADVEDYDINFRPLTRSQSEPTRPLPRLTEDLADRMPAISMSPTNVAEAMQQLQQSNFEDFTLCEVDTDSEDHLMGPLGSQSSV